MRQRFFCNQRVRVCGWGLLSVVVGCASASEFAAVSSTEAANKIDTRSSHRVIILEDHEDELRLLLTKVLAATREYQVNESEGVAFVVLADLSQLELGRLQREFSGNANLSFISYFRDELYQTMTALLDQTARTEVITDGLGGDWMKVRTLVIDRVRPALGNPCVAAPDVRSLTLHSSSPNYIVTFKNDFSEQGALPTRGYEANRESGLTLFREDPHYIFSTYAFDKVITNTRHWAQWAQNQLGNAR